LRVLRGGSAEAASNRWVKFDIELDESDLQALVIQHGLDSEALTVVQKFSLLVKQAEFLVTVRMESLGVQGEQTAQDLSNNLDAYIKMLKKV
jgi:hypothetical protein